MDVRFRIPVASVIHFPGLKRPHQGIGSRHHFLKQSRLDLGLQFVKLTDMALEED
jgi:hypothetical protein